MLLSRSGSYAFFKIPSPPKVSTPAGITVQQVISPASTSSLTGGNSITGFALNSAGEAFLTTANGNNKIFKMTSASTPSFVANIAVNDMGADLTSCSTPNLILSTSFQKFSVELGKDIQLNWSAVEESTVAGYNIESSKDGQSWRTLAYVPKKVFNGGNPTEYNYWDEQFSSGKNYYRINQLHHSGKKACSMIRIITALSENQVIVGPNPAANFLYIKTKNNRSNTARIYDDNGRLVLTTFSVHLMHL